MDVPLMLAREYIVLLVALFVLAAALGTVFSAAACLLARCFPAEEGNRPAPPSLLAANEAARHAAILRIGARAEAWRQFNARRKGQDR